MTHRRRRAGHTRRFTVLQFLLVCALVGVGARLVWFQVISAPAFAERAESQRLREWELAARRGSIYDREGEPLAVTVEGRSIYAVPSAVSDPVGAAKALSSVLGGAEEEYLAAVTREADFVYLERKVDLEKAETLQEMDLAGIHFHEDYTRHYPSGGLAAQVIGFVGVDDMGLAGLENHYDDLLSGSSGLIVAERDPYGRVIPGGLVTQSEPIDGQSLVLTIDREVQHHAEEELERAVTSAGARAGSIVVMDPRNGEILAMASVPDFDPNRFTESDSAAYRARPITDCYEPGSTAKAFTAAAALEAGLCSPTTSYSLASTIRVADRTIHESHPRGAVQWTVEEIVAYSSNVGAVTIGRQLGAEGLFEAYTRYGLTEQTGVDFPGEARGLMLPPDQWSPSTIGNVPFGQGVSVTVLQLARALGAIANGGELVTPHFLKSVPGSEGPEPDWPTERAMSEESAAAMRGILTSAVQYGTGGLAAVPGYRVAGKTGTAQKAVAGQGYVDGKYVASFAGFLPAEDPQVLIVVTVDEPTRGIYGGPTAGPAFSEVARFCVTHLAIPPANQGEQ